MTDVLRRVDTRFGRREMQEKVDELHRARIGSRDDGAKEGLVRLCAAISVVGQVADDLDQGCARRGDADIGSLLAALRGLGAVARSLTV